MARKKRGINNDSSILLLSCHPKEAKKTKVTKPVILSQFA